MSQALATNTRHTYGTAWRKYLAFCNMFGLPTVPPSSQELETNLLRFFSWMAGAVKSSTIDTYFSGVRSSFLYLSGGKTDISEFFHLQRLREGIRREYPAETRYYPSGTGTTHPPRTDPRAYGLLQPLSRA